MVEPGGWGIDGGLRDKGGAGGRFRFRCPPHPPSPKTKRPLLVFPVFCDVEVPFPGQVVMLVVVGKLGFDSVVAAGY